MSDTASSTSGFRTMPFQFLLDCVNEEVPPQYLVKLWNRYLSGIPGKVQKYEARSRKLQQKVADTLARSMRERLRESTVYSKVETMPSGELRVVGDDTPIAMVEEVLPKPTPKPAPTTLVGVILSAATQTKTPTPPSSPEPVLDAEDHKLIFQAASESDAALAAYNERKSLERKQQEAVMQTADELKDALHRKTGDDLYRNTLVVRTYSDLKNHRAVFVCSSTIPHIMGDAGGPSVKHDFRANERPVTHSHPLAYKQGDGMKVIRSTVIQKGAHEYYVKALEYEEGMVFKGYFVVEGIEDASKVPPIFSQLVKGKVVTITEAQYWTAVNKISKK